MRNYTSAINSVDLWQDNLQINTVRTYLNWDSHSYDTNSYVLDSTYITPNIAEIIKVSIANAEDAETLSEKKETWRDITQEPDEANEASQNKEAESDTIETAMQGKELDARVGGFEENPSVTYGNFASVDDKPRNLDIGAESNQFIRDNPVDTFSPPLDGIVPDVPQEEEEEEENCIDGEWTFNLAYVGETVINNSGEEEGEVTAMDFLFNPDEDDGSPPVIFSVTISFSDGDDTFTFSSDLGPEGLTVNQIVNTQQVLPGVFTSFITASASVIIPVVDLPGNFVPTDLSVSFQMDLAAPDSQNSLRFFLQNGNGANLGVFQLGPQMFDPGPVPFFTGTGFNQFNSSNFEDGSYFFSDDAENAPPAGNITPGEYPANPNSFESMLPYVCTPQLLPIPTFPVGIDLDGDGIELIAADDSNILFDANQDGLLEQIAWTSPDDGMLIYDYDQNQLVTQLDEFSLVSHAPSANSDLEALGIAFDSNQDGVFNADDAEWSKFGVWQDLNTNGVTDEGEFLSLESLGITGISTVVSGDLEEALGSYVLGSSEVQWQNESSGKAYDLALAVAPADNQVTMQTQMIVDNTGEAQLI